MNASSRTSPTLLPGLRNDIALALIQSIPLISSHPSPSPSKPKDRLARLHLFPLEYVPNSDEDERLGEADPSLVQRLTKLETLQLLFRNPKAFASRTLMNITEFLDLHSELEEAISGVRHGGNRESPHSHPMPTLLNTVEQLLLWILYMQEVGIKSLGLCFGLLVDTTVFRYVDHVTDCINHHLAHSLRWPSPAERRCYYGYFSVCREAVAIVDGTHCEIEEQVDDPHGFWSGYKHKDTQNYLIYVNVLGIIIKVEGPFKGRANDMGVFNQSDLGLSSGSFLSPGERILADGGFPGAAPLLIPINNTIIEGEQGSEERQRMKDRNDHFKDSRVLVEDVIGWVKARAKRLSHRYTRDRETQGPEFYASCRVHNHIRWNRISYTHHS